MSESEQNDPQADVEDGQNAQEGAIEEDKSVKEEAKPLQPIDNLVRNSQHVPEVTVEGAGDGNDGDGDSEAETLIQSPEKKRNSVVEGSAIIQHIKVSGSDTGSTSLINNSDKENATRKRKRHQEEGSRASPSRFSSHHSSPLSSPMAHIHSGNDSDGSAVFDIRISSHKQDDSDDRDKLSLPRKRRRRPSEIIPPSSLHKRSKRSSIDTLERRETRSATYPHPSDDEKSASPEPIARREHRRGASTQLTTGEFEKKKRGRPPLINTRRNQSADRASNSSEESEPRSSRAHPLLHKLASNDIDTMSPAKVGPRKWKDKNGRTYLARACANNDVETARQRLIERPEDLNTEDNAGNTALQIASLEGYEHVVEFLLSKGAEVNVRNVDKDTPLIDAVENGHVEVIDMLLKHGANPRMGNAKGDEPYELVPSDDEAYEQIRAMLADAKDKDAKKTPGGDQSELHNRDGASSRAASAASPRDSPPAGPRSPPAFGSRRRTGRSDSTRNDLLWQANTQENLAKLASKGDVQGVANILSILEKADTEALIAAAKAGHEEVLQLLIAMGKPSPDPEPVRSSKLVPGYNTPMLAAIGRGHPDVVKLLTNQAGFNPTKRHGNKTYYELADERRGNRWEEEFTILKASYDRAKGKKTSSPKKIRDLERPKTRRRSSSVNSAKHQLPSPTATHKSLPMKAAEMSPRQRRKVSDPVSENHRTNSGDTGDSSLAIASDLDQIATVPRMGHRTRRSQSDLPPVPALGHEPTQKRRRLVTGKEHRRQHTLSTSSDNDEGPEMIEVKQGGRPRKKRRTVLESSPMEVTRPAVSIENEIRRPVESSTEPTEAGTISELFETNTILDSVYPSATAQLPDSEVFPDADVEAEESDDHYSPPPAVEPSDADLEAERLAVEEAELRKQKEEQLEREKAAEELRLTQEAEEREREEQQAAQVREEEAREERRRQEIEARRRLQQIEQERERLDALPIVLSKTAQMIDDNDPEVRSQKWLSKFLPIFTVSTRQMDPTCSVSTDELWIPSFQVAGLLATKDLDLRSFPSLGRASVTLHQRQCLWRVARLKLSYDFNPLWNTTVSQANDIELSAQEKFMSMQKLSWIRLSDFINEIPRFPHLVWPLPTQAISLKSYTEILGPKMKAGGLSKNLPNGIHTNGENGIT